MKSTTLSKKKKEVKVSNYSFSLNLTDYQIMKHISKTCKGYENLLVDIKK